MSTPTKGITFKDVLIIPQYSDLKSREEVDVSHKGMGIPVISAAMDVITGPEMQKAMKEKGGMGIHHRYCDLNELAANTGAVACSPSMGEEFLKKSKAHTLVLDVAHGDSKRTIEYAQKAKKITKKQVISANIVTPEAAERYWQAGIDTFKVGVGTGGACTTREVTGVGYPQLSALMNIRGKFPNATIWADGGIKTSGDILKALAAGADAVILGGMLAGCQETPSPGIYRGMASKEAREQAGKEVEAQEGESKNVPLAGSASDLIDEIASSLRAGLAYVGARNIKEFHQRARFVKT